MTKTWVVQWRNLRTGSTGVGDQRFTREDAEAWARELNDRPCNAQLQHQAVEVK